MKLLSKSSPIAALSAIGLLFSTTVRADCDFIDGNYYCSETDAVVYSNVGYSGFYKDVTSMDESSCACSQQSVAFSGNLAPLDEELSVHFRGPINLVQFGVYYPASSSSSLKKRDVAAQACSTIKHQHKRDVVVEYVEVTSTVYVNGNGDVVSSTDAATGSFTTVSTVLNGAQTSATSSTSTSTTAVAPVASSSSSSSSSGAWKRSSYFVPGSATNCVFMNNMGGTAGSGTWSSCFGNSISFAASDGINGAASPQALGDVTVASGKEFMIFSGSECSGTNDCGYYRDGIPAYHGFGGQSKIFVFEFSMPSDTDGSGYNQDMPAIWLLNAKIPRTLQYGNSECSCWSTGCGELDLFEILSAGSDKLITHIHDGQSADGTSTGGGGTQDYFARPTSGTLKAAVIFNGDDKTIHIVEVNEDFDEELSESTVSAWLAKAGSSATLS